MATDNDYQALAGQFGPTSFLKARVVAQDTPWSADIAFLGIPFDQATGFARNTLGPQGNTRSIGTLFGYIGCRSTWLL